MAVQPPLPPRTSKNDALIMATPYEKLTERQKLYADRYGLTLQPPSAPAPQTPVAQAVNAPQPTTGLDYNAIAERGYTQAEANSLPALPPPPTMNELIQQGAGMGVQPYINIAQGSNPNGTPVTADNNYYPAAPDFDTMAKSDPEYLLAIQRLNEELANAKAKAHTGKTQLQTQLQNILRQYDRGQEQDTQDHLGRFGGRGMLYSGRQVEDLGGINYDYATRRNKSQQDELEAELGLDTQINDLERGSLLDKQGEFYNTINRLKSNAGDYYRPPANYVDAVNIPGLSAVAGAPTRAFDPETAAILRRMLGQA